MVEQQSIRIGGATGFWGETDLAMEQFLQADCKLDFIVFDYLAEITMSILARARAGDAELGYATDFVTTMVQPHLTTLAESGIKLISNAGGVNPEGCARAIRKLIDAAGLDLTVAVVTGDDLLDQVEHLAAANVTEMFSGERLPPIDKIASANAYIGAVPIARALDLGADIVVTGRCVDSAVTLGACLHAFKWGYRDLDLLAAGSLVGHLIECGPQMTGGNYTDWESVAESLTNVGYPIAEVSADGAAIVTKPRGTGGVVSRGSVGEQLLYEIGDPQNYILPDVICDFSRVELEQAGEDRVRVTGARGRGVPSDYKVSMTWADGWRAGTTLWYLGRAAARKGRLFAEQVVSRTRRKLAGLGMDDFDALEVEVVGNESHWGVSARDTVSREVAIKIACRHQDKRAVALLLREVAGASLGAPPGLAVFAGTRAKPSPVIRLFSTLVPKSMVTLGLQVGVERQGLAMTADAPTALRTQSSHEIPQAESEDSLVEVPLERLAWARSGDKGNKANVGVMARRAEFLPWIAQSLTETYVAGRFGHFMADAAIDRYYLPGIHALNFVLHNALGGGGVASLRNDPQAKSYAQILLDAPIVIPSQLLEDSHGSTDF